MHPPDTKILTFDIGGTLVKLGVVDASGQVLATEQIDTDAHRGGAALLAELLDVARPLLAQHLPAGIAFSTLGIVDAATGNITGAADAIPGYLGQSPKRLFETAFGLPVLVENDVNCVAVAEGWTGAASGIDNYIALTLGTGIGGGIVIGGQLYRGAHAAAGEWGYMIVNGQLWEDVASLRGLATLAAQAIPGCCLDAEQVFAQYDQGDKDYLAVVQRWIQLLASGVVNLIYAFDPQRIIIGGGITGRGPVFLHELQQALDGLLHPDFRGRTEFRLAAAGNSAGMLGAARCWLQQHPPAAVSTRSPAL
ncbi:ROK family protein [Rhodoferax sp.]|uniref:ROK family protein n=1 Tax=Rhodoferax sp. TaxID=50421 RepID=UPI00374D8720